MTRPLVIVGDVLMDRDVDGNVDRLCPDAPVPVVDGVTARSRAGGAGLAATLAARSGRDVVLITALAADEAGRELRALLEQCGVEVLAMPFEGSTPEKIRVRADGRTLIRLDRGDSPAAIQEPPPEALRALGSGTVLVSDYGRGVAAKPSIRDALARHAASAGVVWDPHPKGGDPVPQCRLVTPNRTEAQLHRHASLTEISNRARELAAAWRAASVAITMSASGALLVTGQDIPPLAVPAPHVAIGDPCGAGDCFGVTAAALLADGGSPAEAVRGAVLRASAFVSSGGAAAMHATPERNALTAEYPLDAVLRAAENVKARGGRVVATGGCFDILHAGHVASLHAARSLGDFLVVCLNSDASVRRLKGPGRPVVSEGDRAEVLRALGCVDAVVVFDESTPEAVLRRLQPQIFAKGADYALADMPESELVRSWGGEAVLVPYLDGRSTSGLLEEMRLRAG